MSLEATRREPDDCPSCGGTGSTVPTQNDPCGDVCADCNGTGTIDSEPSCEPENYLDGDEPSYRREVFAARELLAAWRVRLDAADPLAFGLHRSARGQTMSRKAASDRLTDRDFIQLCAEWPFAQLPLEASLRLSLISANDKTGMGRRAFMFARKPIDALRTLYAVTPAGQVTT